MSTRKTWRKLHRTIGLYSCVWLFLIASTGLILSFSQSLELEQTFFSFKQKSIALEDITVTLRHGRGYLNQQAQGVRCDMPVIAVREFQTGVLLACQNILYWLTKDGDIIESHSVAKHLKPLKAAYFLQQSLFIENASSLLKWDIDQARLAVVDDNALIQEIARSSALSVIELEVRSVWQWLMNVHTGLIAGDLGRWLFRLAGLGLIMLCITGAKNALR